jgi:galactokinase
MTDSGQSSNLAYEISHPRVEELVALLLTREGVIGARMMGGGEGGPALALIHQDALADVSAVLEAGYFRDNPSHLQGERLQVCVFGPGARLNRLD